MKTAFLFIYHPSHISDLLQTEWVKEVAQNLQLVIFLPERERGRSWGQTLPTNVICHYHQSPNNRLFQFFKLLRLSTIRKFDHFKTIEYFYQLSFSDWRRKFLRFFTYPIHWLLTPDFYSFWERRLIQGSDSFGALISQYKPQILITATPGFTPFEAEAILMAQKHKLPTVALNFSWDNLSSNSKSFRRTDYLICWNEMAQEEALKYYDYAADRVFISGIPRFDYYFSDDQSVPTREAFLKGKGLDPNQKTVFITTVPKTTFPHQREVIQNIIDIRNQASPAANFNIFIRVHPIDVMSLYDSFINLPDVCIERAGQLKFSDNMPGQKVEMTKADLLNLKYSLRYCDVVVNYASTMSLEAFIFDKPVINIGFDELYNMAYQFTHYEPLVKAASVVIAHDAEELGRWLWQSLDNPGLNRSGRQKIFARYIKFRDGLSGRRSAMILNQIMNRL